MLQHRKRRVVSYTMCVVLLASIWSMGLSYAGNSAQDKLDEINANKNKTEQQLKQGKKEAAALSAEIKKLEQQINAAQGDIDSIQTNIASTKSKIAATEQNLKMVQEEMVQQNDNMNERIVAMYKGGDMGMLEVLLSSTDLSEFMSNMDMMQRIYDNDIELLKTMQTQYDKITLQKKELVSMQEELRQQQKSQEEKQSILEVSRGSVADKKSSVLKNNAALEDMIDDLNDEADALVEEIKALQGNGVYSGGALSWPVPGSTRITSPFGYRTHPILHTKKLHTGIDIGVSSGNSVKAAADGKVIKAGWNNSYGNVVMVDHGSGMVTLYAHNSSLLVSAGDEVKRGDAIAKSGSTGMSTGPHVHFEVRINGKYVDPMGYL